MVHCNDEKGPADLAAQLFLLPRAQPRKLARQIAGCEHVFGQAVCERNLLQQPAV